MPPTPATDSFDVIIIGGGLSGLLLANALAHYQFHVAIIETKTPKDIQKQNDGRCSAIAYGSQQFMQSIGVWDKLEAHAGAIRDIWVSDNDAPVFLHYNYTLTGDHPMGYMVANTHMLQGFFDTVETHEHITLFAPERYTQIESNQTGHRITLECGKTLSAPLLIGADGKFSRIRDWLGIEAKTHNYHQTGIVCTIKHEIDHEGLAQERFLHTGPFAALPMHGGYHSSLVWTESDYVAPQYLHMDDEKFLAEIQYRMGDYLGKLSLASERFSYPLKLVHAKSYAKNRTILIGDAAHAIHPLAGQGFNLGIRDIEKLTGILVNQRRLGLDIGAQDCLKTYQELRNFDALSLIAITDGLNRLFACKNPLVTTARRMGMNAVQHLPALKKKLMQHAMGV